MRCSLAPALDGTTAINHARIDSLQEQDASRTSARLEAQRRERLRNDAFVMAEAQREERARHAAAQAEADRQEAFRQRRLKDHENHRFEETQQIFDRALQPWGRTAPAARADENYGGYLRRMTNIAQSYLPAGHELARLEFVRGDDRVPRDVLIPLSDQVLSGIKQALRDPTTVAAGKMRLSAPMKFLTRLGSR
jgi:hypothetical protein